MTPVKIDDSALTRSRGSLFLLVIVLAGFGLRLYRLGADSLWYDETVSAFLASASPAELVTHTARDIHPPGYYLLLHFWTLAAGHSEFALVFFSLGFGLLLIPLTYQLARLLGNRQVAIWAALLVAVSPYHLWYSQEVRMYTLGAVLGICAAYCGLRALSHPDRVGSPGLFWAGYGAAAVAGLYTLYYFAFLLLVLNGLFLLYTLRPAFRLRALRFLVLANGLALLAYLPGLAREAGEPGLADLSEGFNLILIRPEVAAEGLRAVVSRGAEEQGSRGDELESLFVNPPKARQAKSEIENLYGLCLEALEANTVARIVSLQAPLADPRDSSVVATLVVPPVTTEVVTTMESPLAELSRVAQTLHNYERVETVEDKIAYLAQAIETLGRLDREFQATLSQPERNIFSRIAFNWLMVTTNALEDLQGRAQIEVALKTRQVLSFDQTTLALELTNTGRSPASNLTISLVPDPLYAVGNGAAQLDILSAGRSAIVELAVSAAPSVGQFRAKFAITFDDRERSGKQVAFADLVRLLKPNTVFQTLPNPYAPGTPLRPGSPIFFGRDDLFQFMVENLGGATRQNVLVLIGQRRMGKTSFLQQLPARLGQTYLPVYLDGQSLGIDPGMANFFYDLSLAIADALADQGCAIAEPELADFQERPSGVFERTFLPAVFEAIGSRRLLLLFDEFEELEMRVASGKLEATIFPFFRHLMQHADKLGFIFVGTHRLEELTADYWSILFNMALYKRVTFLSEAAAKALIVEPVASSGLVYDDLALDKIVRVTAGHPYFLQLICHALVNQANREGRGYLTIRDVNDTLLELVDLGEAHFAFLWEQSSPVEQLILTALMRLLTRTPPITVTQIVELLAERGKPLELQVVSQALRRLTERDIVRELGDSPPHYEYKVDLVRLWVERYKALGRVMEEVNQGAGWVKDAITMR
ncbi:MAG: hypothetical protein HC875_36830 [Anaerolineales bacterium]|nr:hypothetical protein [Anaerolineales bacterium]